SQSSKEQLTILTNEILIPLGAELGLPIISYGFNCPQLLRWIQSNSPKDTAPLLDQHASMELNLKGNRICKRDGAACDFLIEGKENQMHIAANFIIQHLSFDRLYFYGKDKPLHVSIGADNTRYVQIRQAKSSGRRVAGPSRTGSSALELFEIYNTTG
ncbi:hypothetical protein, partial [Vibrio genomosp. F10]